MKKFFIGILCIFSLLVVSSQNIGQRDQKEDNKSRVKDEELPRQAIWVATCGGGQFMLGLGSIVSLAKQVYVLDGSAVISEVTVDSTGNALARFYYIEPITEGSNFKSINTANERIAELTERAVQRMGGNATQLTKDNTVFKQYPTTSHAKTIEFRLSSASDLDALYESVTKAWRSGKGRSFQCP